LFRDTVAMVLAARCFSLRALPGVLAYLQLARVLDRNSRFVVRLHHKLPEQKGHLKIHGFDAIGCLQRFAERLTVKLRYEHESLFHRPTPADRGRR
jgi:hypothetical protein